MTRTPLPPSPEDLHKLLRYEPETGKLFWLRRGPEWFSNGAQTAEHNAAIWNAKFAGREALTALFKGYRGGTLLGRLALAHRVAFAMANGKWPENQVDHIDGDRLNNRASNLRDVTNKQNGQNAGRPRTNSSGVVGVHWLKRERLWHARIRTENKVHALGYFKDRAEAVHARKAAEVAFGFTQNDRRGS